MANGQHEVTPITLCWCGCGEGIQAGADFRQGHDVKAALAAITVDYGSVQKFIEAHHGPDKNDYSLMVTFHEHQAKTMGGRARIKKPQWMRRGAA